MDNELKLVGEFGLRNKREVWRVQRAVSSIRTAARELLTLPPEDAKRLFEGGALLRRLHKIGVLEEQQNKVRIILIAVKCFITNLAKLT